MMRSRSLVISQNTWITICWKVIMEFLPNFAKKLLHTATLNDYVCKVKMWLNFVNMGHERTADCNVKVTLKARDTNSGLLDESLVFVGPIHLPSCSPCVSLLFFKLRHHTPGTLSLRIYCCCGWVYIVVNGTPGASHTAAKGCLVLRHHKPTVVTKPRYLTSWEWKRAA